MAQKSEGVTVDPNLQIWTEHRLTPHWLVGKCHIIYTDEVQELRILREFSCNSTYVTTYPDI
jgi:hypothetical protein